MKKIILLAIFLLMVGFCAQAQAALELPDPDDTIDGVTLASHYGDFYTFPTSLMIDLITRDANNDNIADNAVEVAAVGAGTADDWKVVTGVGQLDILSYTGPGGIDNNPVSYGPAFPEPIHPPNNSETAEGTWGLPDADDPSGLTVGQMLNYIQHYNPGTSTPVFGFDMSESQGQNAGYLQVWGQVRIVDSADANPADPTHYLKKWVLEEPSATPDLNNPLHVSPYVYAPTDLAVPGTLQTYYINNANTGGGRIDYVVFAPSMILDDPNAIWDSNDLFLMDLKFRDLSGNDEDVFLTTMYFVPGEGVVPEPASMALLGLGLVGLLKRKRV